MCAHKERFNYFCDIQFSLQVILFFTADGFAVGRQRLCSLEITANVGILTLGSLLVKRQMLENASYSTASDMEHRFRQYACRIELNLFMKAGK